MKEARICWQPTVVHDEDDQKVMARCSRWVPLTEKSLREIHLLCNAANQVYGAETHWMETRKLPGIPDFC